MYVELQSKEVRPRKAHDCEWCAERIDKGEKCHYRVYVWDEGFQSGWSHPECWDAIVDAPLDEKQRGWAPGDFKRGSQEYA